MNEEITNKDLHYIVQEIKDKVSDIKENVLPEIRAQVAKTNGSVAEIKSWKERSTGAGYVILLVVVPLLSWALYQVVKLNNEISQQEQTTKELIEESLVEAIKKYGTDN